MNQLCVGFSPELCNVDNITQCSELFGRFFILIAKIAGINVTYIPLTTSEVFGIQEFSALEYNKIDAILHGWPLGHRFGNLSWYSFSSPIKLREYSFIYEKKLILQSTFWFMSPFSISTWIVIPTLVILTICVFGFRPTTNIEASGSRVSAAVTICRPLVNQAIEPINMTASQTILLAVWYIGVFLVGPKNMAEAIEYIERGEYPFIWSNVWKDDHKKENITEFLVRDMPNKWRKAWKQIIPNARLTKLIDPMASLVNVVPDLIRSVITNDGIAYIEHSALVFYEDDPSLILRHAYTAVTPHAYLFTNGPRRNGKIYDRFNEAMMMAYFYGLDQKLEVSMLSEFKRFQPETEKVVFKVKLVEMYGIFIVFGMSILMVMACFGIELMWNKCGRNYYSFSLGLTPDLTDTI